MNGAAPVQSHVPNANGRVGRRKLDRVSSPGNGAVHFRAVQECARYGAEETAVWDRADREGFSERDQSTQLHFPLARVRADGARIFLPGRGGDEVARVLEGRAN